MYCLFFSIQTGVIDLINRHGKDTTMSILNKILGVKSQEQSKNTKSTDLIIPSKPLFVHPDIEGLLWIADGPKKNYIHKPTYSTYEIEGVRFSVRFGHDVEPSLISIREPITVVGDQLTNIERPPYYPTYSQLTPQQKGLYWKLLENPYNPNIDIGFVFILYYGLERHLLEGDFERAYQVILKLRDAHQNKSFQSYSACALILTSLFRKRPDLAACFLESLDKEYELNFPNNMLLLCKYGLDMPLNSQDIMRIAKSFEFENTNYIKKYPDIFSIHLREEIHRETGLDTIDIKQYLSPVEWRKLRKQSVPMYANVSIQDKTIEMPIMSDCFKLKRIIYNLLEQAHNETKKELSSLRKEGVTPSVQSAVPTKVKTPLVFDAKQEKALLNDASKSQRVTEKHFAYIALQDFYYKYRDCGEEYLQKCMQICEKDIALLPQLQREHLNEEEKRILAFSSVFSKQEVASRLRKIVPFSGNIPAFFRLAVIYEKKKEIASAIAICKSAIEYYKSIGMDTSAEEFIERRKKLSDKM